MLRSQAIKSVLMRQIDKRSEGPKEKQRKESDMYLWGEVSDGNQKMEARLKTPNGYTLTALTTVTIAQKILSGNFKPGFQTPSSAYGEGFILEIEGCSYL